MSPRGLLLVALLAACGGTRVTGAVDAAPRDAPAPVDMPAPVDAADDRSDANDPADPTYLPWDAGAADPACNAVGWCWENPAPAGGSIVSISSGAPDDGWALTREGVLLHATATGVRALRSHPNDPALAEGSVWSSGPDDAWVTLRNALLRWDGITLREARFGGASDVPWRVWGGGAADVWVAGLAGDVRHWDGARWERRRAPTGLDLVSLAGTPDGEAWTQDASGVVYRWRGGRWVRGERRNLDDHRAPWVLGPDDAWSCGDGTAFHWDGAAWGREVVDRAPASIRCAVWGDGADVWFSDGASVRRRNAEGRWDFESESRLATAAGGTAANLWVGRDDGVIQRVVGGRWVGVTATRPRFDVVRITGSASSGARAITAASIFTFDGVGWNEIGAPARYLELTGVWTDGGDDAWLAGRVGAPGGDTGRASRWSRTAGERDALEVPSPLRAVSAVDASHVWAVGDGGLAYRFDGTSWTRTPTGTAASLRDVWAFAPDVAWAVGDGGVALRWDGGSWVPERVPVPGDLARVHGRSPLDVWAVGANPATGLSFVVRWDGRAWSRDTAGLPANYEARGVWAAPDGAVWLAGTTILRRDARVWNAEPSGTEATLRAVWGTVGGAVRVGGSTSTILVRR